MRMIIALLFCSSLFAKSYDAKQVVAQILNENIIVKSYLLQKDEILGQQRQVKGKYDYYLSLKGSMLRDKTLQDSQAAPRDMDYKSFKMELNKQWAWGIKSQLFVGNDLNDYTGINFSTFNSQRYEKKKASVGAGISVDLSQNIGGRVDRAILNNLQDQELVAQMGTKEKIEQYLFLGLNSFYAAILSQRTVLHYQEMRTNAESLLRKAQKRRKRGIIDNRELLVYQSNLSSIDQLLIMARKNLDRSIFEFEKFASFDFIQSDFMEEDKISNKEKSYLVAINEQDFATVAQESRSLKILEKEIQIEKRNFKNAGRTLLPEMSLTVQATGAGNDVESDTSWNQATNFEHPQYLLGMSINYPLGNSKNRNNYYSKKYAFLRKQLEYQDQLKTKVDQLNLYAFELKKLMTMVEMAQTHLTNEKKKFKNELKEYGRGRSNARDVVQFQNDYLAAKLKMTEAIINYKLGMNRYLLSSDKFASHYDINFEGVAL